MTSEKVIEQVRSCKNIINATRHTLEELKKKFKEMEEEQSENSSKLELKDVDDRDVMVD